VVLAETIEIVPLSTAPLSILRRAPPASELDAGSAEGQAFEPMLGQIDGRAGDRPPDELPICGRTAPGCGASAASGSRSLT
jgi:hypothetical protein